MKRIVRFAVCAALCAALLTANLGAAFSAETKFFSKVDMLYIDSHIEADADLGSGATVQGACVDGDYAYFAFMNGNVCNIAKFNAHSWEYIEKKKISNMGHSNDMTYNSDKGYLVVANNAPYYDVVTLVDPDTLEPIKDVKIDEDIYSISYNATRKKYVVGLSGSYDFALLDSDFKVVDKFEGVKTGYTRQGGDCDDDYIYFVQSGGNNLLVIYDYSGKHIADIPMTDSDEVENIFHIGNTFYTSLYYRGNTLYRIGFSPATDISYKVIYGAGYDIGDDAETMKATTVTYGETTKLSPCEYDREGYFFSGWRVQRTCDGKYIGYRNGSKDYEWLDSDEVFEYLLFDDEEPISETVRFGNVKLTAQWIAEQYEIQTTSGEGEGEGLIYTVAHDEEYTVPNGGYVREGYVFDGFSASRAYDDRVYGYRSGSDKAEWLYPSDAEKLHIFHPGDTVKALTPEGRVTMKAEYKYAYTFGEDGSTLVEYVGVDEKVSIPSNDGELKTLAEGSIKDNENMTDLYIPAGVNELNKQAISNCPKLRKIYFEGRLPEKIDGECYVGDEAPVLYEMVGDQAFCVGFLCDQQSVPVIRYLSRSLENRSAAGDFRE